MSNYFSCRQSQFSIQLKTDNNDNNEYNNVTCMLDNLTARLFKGNNYKEINVIVNMQGNKVKQCKQMEKAGFWATYGFRFVGTVSNSSMRQYKQTIVLLVLARIHYL